MKRTFDLVVACLALVPALPLMAVMALVLRLTQGSPILFVQERAGRHGTPFRLFKFRTMTDARDASGQLLPDAARVTSLGRLLRRIRVDEIPQLFSVASGQMSVVGPRPLLPQTVAAFGDLGVKRGQVRPGLTGWAQISGNALLDPRDKVALDLWYVDHRSFWLDLIIIFKTLQVVIGGEEIDASRLTEATEHAFGHHGEKRLHVNGVDLATPQHPETRPQ